MAYTICKPLEFLTSDVNILLILLNQPIAKENVLKKLWNNAVLTVCCDGAANQLHNVNLQCDLDPYLIPSFICGDLDSVKKDVVDVFKKKKVEIINLPDQNATDFTKSTSFAVDYCTENGINYDVIVSYPGIGGHLDATLSNINTLYKIDSFQSKPCYLLSDVESTCLLKPGKSKIIVNSGLEGEWCGLLPIGFEVENVSTSGLVYNLHDSTMKFGGTPMGISTSNAIAKGSTEVVVDTSHCLLWALSYTADKV